MIERFVRTMFLLKARFVCNLNQGIRCIHCNLKRESGCHCFAVFGYNIGYL